MIGVLELKRRLIWLWRLCLSELVEHQVAGGRLRALWVFDTLHQPDGAVLREYVEDIARRERLRLHSFGPRRCSIFKEVRASIALLGEARLIFSRNFDTSYHRRLLNKLNSALGSDRPAVLLVGASKGTFAGIARHLDGRPRLWEVQHGLLDGSYFPMHVERFCARSTASAIIVREMAPEVKVDIVSTSLNPPHGRIEMVRLDDIGEIVCFSKNPGGGCAPHELAAFESACYAAARRHGCHFLLRLHPRDNILKLLCRHRRIAVAKWVICSSARLSTAKPRLVISAYSSALVSESREGDFVLNAMIGTQNNITHCEYKWVPMISVPFLRTLPSSIDVFLRTN